MKFLPALLLALLSTIAACKDQEPPKPALAAKPGEPARPEIAKVEPAAPAAPAPPERPAPASAESHEPAEPASSPMTVDEAGAKALALADKFAKVIAEAGDDCAKLGAGLRGMSGDLQTSGVLEKAFVKDEAKKREFSRRYEQQLTARMQPVLPVLQKCMQNPEVQNALKPAAQ